MKLKRKEFERLVISSLKEIPKLFRDKMENIEIVIEKSPSREILSRTGLKSHNELLGLYQGVPLGKRGFYYGNVLPDKITLFQIPIELQCKTKEDIKKMVKSVIFHEMGHYFGLDEYQLMDINDLRD